MQHKQREGLRRNKTPYSRLRANPSQNGRAGGCRQTYVTAFINPPTRYTRPIRVRPHARHIHRHYLLPASCPTPSTVKLWGAE